MAQTTGKSLRVKNADAPDETRKFEGKGHLDVLDFGEAAEDLWTSIENDARRSDADPVQLERIKPIVQQALRIAFGRGALISVKERLQATAENSRPYAEATDALTGGSSTLEPPPRQTLWIKRTRAPGAQPR
jgi:hypothetical protein